MLIFVVCGSICGVRVVEIVITVFLSFNGSIAAYQSLQLDAGARAGDATRHLYKHLISKEYRSA